MASRSPFPSHALLSDDEGQYWDSKGENHPPGESCFIGNGEEGSCCSTELFVGNLLWDGGGGGGEELNYLLSKEEESGVSNGLVESPSLSMARGEAVEWILEVSGCCSFSALTAVLAVNYLDRFLCIFNSQGLKPWMSQLSAVACLSLAAKVEETDVPLLLDLQVKESKYMFESKTIQRMEVLVLSTLEWKMNPVTPLSFLDHIARKLSLKGHSYWEFLRRCECLILSVIPDRRFLSYLPSAFATATMLAVLTTLHPSWFGQDHRDNMLGILGINKDKVLECHRLIQEVGTSFGHSSNKRKSGCFPGSPKSVVDVCFSSDAFSDSVSSSPEPLSKKTKCQKP